MTREQVAEKIRWSTIIWVVGMVNPLFMVPQLYKIWETGTATGVSLITMIILFFLQTGFGLHGFFRRDSMLMVSNALACTVTFSTTTSAVYFGASW